MNSRFQILQLHNDNRLDVLRDPSVGQKKTTNHNGEYTSVYEYICSGMCSTRSNGEE